MPVAVVAGIAALGAAAGGAFGAFLIMYATEIGTAAMLLGTVALSNAQRRKAERRSRAQYNAAQVDRLANVPGTVSPRELVLGRVRKGGHVFFRGSVGAHRDKFVMLIALAAHEIDAVEQIYINDQAVTLDADGFVTSEPYMLRRTESGMVFNGPAPAHAIPESVQVSYPSDGYSDYYTHFQYYVYTPKARVRWVLGGPGQAADARLMQLFPGQWTSAHRADGVAYLICEFDYDETAFPSGLPSVTALIRGARVYDPRTGNTAWTQNPALMARHVLLHPQFGMRTSLTADEEARIIAAANACDTSHDYGDGAVPLYRAATVLPFGSSARDALDDLVQAMAGAWAYAAGEFFVRAGTYSAPVLSLNDTHLAVVTRENGGAESQQAITINTHRARNDKINVVVARIWDAAQGYKETALTPLKSAAYIAKDGGAELVQEVVMPCVGYAKQALHIAGVLMRDARDPLTVMLPFKLNAYPVQLFDTVSLTIPRFGWSAKLFTVMSRAWSQDGRVLLTLKETSAAIYQPDAAFASQGYAANTTLPRPWDISPPSLIAVSSGTSELLVGADGTIVTRVRVQWSAIGDLSLLQAGQVEVQWQVPGASSWHSVVVSALETQAYLLGVSDGQDILIRARTRNSLAVSDWGLQRLHTVVGKTEPPPDVASFTIDGDVLRWSPVSALDLAGYMIRFAYGSNGYWGAAAPLHTGVVTDSPYTMDARPSGVVTLMIKALDTSGNESRNPAVIVTNLGDALVSNVLVSWPEAPLFAGTVTDGVVSAGVLQASALDRFYGDDAQPFYGADGEAFYPAGTYAQMVYEWSQTPSEAGTVLLQHAITASDFSISYRRDSQAAFYGADADQFWTGDAEPFYGPPGEWATWPGAMEISDRESVTWRITTAAGAVRGEISAATVVLDVPDVAESLNDVVIAAGGTRLPISQAYRVIQNVQLTVQADGNGGVSARIEDKNASLGPLVTVRNAAGAVVAGLVDADIQGY